MSNTFIKKYKEAVKTNMEKLVQMRRLFSALLILTKLQKSREDIYAPYHVPTPRGYNPFFQRAYTNIYPQVLGNATGSISSKLGESQPSQVLANATRSISSMLSES
ncbi:hypothetical protein GIB67_015729 [Kingdonia uniflora]|uniref:Uncharacterized protein n=1 Tax=Kingdonia uniflora TaxID=39325 RepID=A0A7J7NUA3_9MAGN|nr:hypothetical protein GIB67_015729 [Kingdonia uniflora]